MKVCIALAAHYSKAEQAFVCEEPEKTLNQLFLTFPRLKPFNTVLDAVMTPTVALFLLLSHNCNFAAARNHNVNI